MYGVCRVNRISFDFDRHLRRENFKRNALQCGLAGMAVIVLLLVLDAVKRPTGILTDRDIALRVVATCSNPDSIRVEEVMTRNPKVVDEQTPVEGILALMRRYDIRRLPVVGFDERLIGIVSLDDVMDFMAQQFSELRTLLERSLPRRGVEA